MAAVSRCRPGATRVLQLRDLLQVPRDGHSFGDRLVGCLCPHPRRTDVVSRESWVSLRDSRDGFAPSGGANRAEVGACGG